MKTAILILFFACSFALVASKRCKKQEDCESDECCVRILRIVPATCQKYKKAGDICLSDISDEKDGDVYMFTCPCLEGLKCKPQKEKDDNGVVNFLKDRCE